MKNVKVEFEVALKVGDINECRLKQIIVESLFFFKFSRKLQGQFVSIIRYSRVITPITFPIHAPRVLKKDLLILLILMI